MHLSSAKKINHFLRIPVRNDNMFNDIFYIILHNFTEARHSIDPVNNPPYFKAKILFPRCNKNNINFCTFKDAVYH